MEHPEILPLIVIVIGVLLSSLKKKPQQPLPPVLPQSQPQPPLVAPIPSVEAYTGDKRSDKSAGIETPLIPTAATTIPELPAKPETTKMPTADSIEAVDDAYSSVPHPDVPVGKDWRRAIIAHEILKRKF